eukprot:CAMPEP_0201563678 /NCGR_PEP_ID=MMETSP0190_2-20130828/890_1 /ASSEMBLY_ACC=CAM_ASM_000263 /TAXON_ID=37353 /ORGANISM="Rosalina sp." /LENGTH=157 /DNA_ID=CAMNT_0047978765 /DNA_START=10 /DNA_END=480 /DNA_ORIENTATION=-
MNPPDTDPNREDRGLLGKNTAQFGESDYGERLAYEKPEYRNIFFAILYYIHLIIIIATAGYLWINQYPYIRDNSSWQSDVDLTGIFVGIIGCMIAGVAFGLFWMEIMKRYASTIIKTMLFLNIGCWIAVAILGLIIGEMTLTIIGIVFAAFYALFSW